MLKRQSTIDCPKEFQPDVFNTLCATWIKNLNLQKIYEPISAFASKKFCSFQKPHSPGIIITPKESNISPVAKFHKLFKYL